MNPWGLLGHERAVRAFQGAHRAGRLGHAYLITGVPGSGRRTWGLDLGHASDWPIKVEVRDRSDDQSLRFSLRHRV